MKEKEQGALDIQSKRRECNRAGGIWPLRWHSRSVSGSLNHALSAAGLDGRDSRGEKLVVHSLRHTFATRLARRAAEQNTPLAAVRDILGHASFREIDRYWHSNDKERFGAMRGM